MRSVAAPAIEISGFKLAHGASFPNERAGSLRFNDCFGSKAVLTEWRLPAQSGPLTR